MTKDMTISQKISNGEPPSVNNLNKDERNLNMSTVTARYQQQVLSAALSGTCKVEDRSHVLENVPIVVPTELHNACDIARHNGVQPKHLGQAITRLPHMSRKVFATRRIEDAFQNMIAAFRKSDFRFTCDNGQTQVFVPLRQVLQPLGIVYPEADDDGLYGAVVDFCSKFGIEENDLIDYRFEDFCVPAKNVISFIKAAYLPTEIAVRLTDWFTAFLAERVAGAPWNVPLLEDVDQFC